MDLNRIGQILDKELEDEPIREQIRDSVMEMIKWEVGKSEQTKPHGAVEAFQKIIDKVVNEYAD
jgi:hypothetical protein